jgi:hypothetical protein
MNEKQRAKIQRDLEHAETRFEEELVSALRACAAGHWGVFGRNGEGWDEGGALIALGDEISELRKQLGHTEGFELYDRFAAYRRRRGSNDPGEPKLAQAFLAEIGERATS